MKTKSSPGFAEVYLVVALAVAAVGAGVVVVKKGLHIFSTDNKPKAQVVTLSADADKWRAAEAEAARLRTQADALQAQLEAAKAARAAAAHENIAGAGYALGKEKDPSLNVQAAQILISSADRAMDPITEARILAMQRLVDQLTSQSAADRAAAAKELAEKDALIGQGRQRESALAAQVAATAAEKVVVEGKAAAASSAVAKDEKALESWSKKYESLGARLESFIWWAVVAGGLFLLLFWALPILAKAFPVLAPAVKGATAVFAFGLHALHTGEKKALEAAHDETKSLLEEAEAKLSGKAAA